MDSITYYSIHKLVNTRMKEWATDNKTRKQYNNNYDNFIKSIKKQITDKVNKLGEKQISWNNNIEVVNKKINGNETKFIKFRAVNQLGDLVDVLQYIGKSKYFIHYPKCVDETFYFDTIKDVNDCHDIFVVEHKVKTSHKSKVINIPYLTRYIK